LTALRCTRRLLDRMRATPVETVPAATNALGHWYATLVTHRRVNLVHAISERSLLSIVLPAAPFNSLTERFPFALAELLRALGAPQERIAAEIAATVPMSVAATANRKVLGCLNQYAFELECFREDEPDASILDCELWLAENISSAIKYRHPSALALELLLGGKAQ
jgi:hypothetical protein